MWSDNETDCDFLNFRCVAETAAELIVQANGQPLSIGVSGGWGVGKSSMLRLISASLDEHAEKRFLVVNFNAWLYQGYDDARAALLEVIAERLVDHGRENPKGFEKAKALLARVNWFRVAGLAAGSALAIASGLGPVGLPGMAYAAYKELTDGDVTKQDVNAVVKAGEKVAAAAGTLLKAEESPPRQIHAIRKQFQETLEAMGLTLVVFVDDLDRCLPTTAIATLEAIRLFLFLPRTAFIIAADDRMIRQAVKAHFKDAALTDDLVTNYFDKLVQVPLRVPPLGTQEVRAYMMLLFVQSSNVPEEVRKQLREKVCERLSQSWQGLRVDTAFVLDILGACPDALRANLELADRLAPMMTTSKQIAGNPRLIKRFLNTMSLRLSMAKKQNVVVEESALAKVLLFERCASSEAYAELASAINNSDTGRPAFLAPWEGQAAAGDTITSLSETWDMDFAKGWLALTPPLAKVDLRPVLYVSREHVPLVTAADQLSSAAARVMEALLGEHKRPNVALASALRELPGRERVLIMDRLLLAAKQEQRWGAPSILWACITIVEADPAQAGNLVRFLDALPPASIEPSLVPVLSDKAWGQGQLRKWAGAAGVSQSVKRAISSVLGTAS